MSFFACSCSISFFNFQLFKIGVLSSNKPLEALRMPNINDKIVDSVYKLH